MSHQAEQQADRNHNRQLDHWRWKADRLKPHACTVRQVGKQGFWFIRAGNIIPEFMAWPVSEATAKYGRVSHDV